MSVKHSHRYLLLVGDRSQTGLLAADLYNAHCGSS
jgi:hypothetical protein